MYTPCLAIPDISVSLTQLMGLTIMFFSVVRQIVRFYLHIRKFHLAKIWNINEKGTSVRQQMTNCGRGVSE